MPENNTKKLTHKNCYFEIKSESIDGEGHFSGFASTFGNTDLDNDVILPGAFTKSLESGRRIRLLSQHYTDEPVGVITSAKETPDGLFVEGKLTLEVQKAREIRALILDGAITDFSIGFSIVDEERKPDSGIRLIKEADLFEVSFVTFPANPKANIISMKNDDSFIPKGVIPFDRLENMPIAESSRAWDSEQAIERVRQFLDSTDKPSERYRNAFLWYDSSNEDVFRSYKLPFADVIGDRLTIVPRALSAALGAIRGARGGVDIPQSDLNRIEGMIVRLQEKIRERDDDKINGDQESEEDNKQKSLDIREIEEKARNYGFAKRQAVAFANEVKNIILDGAKSVTIKSEPAGRDSQQTCACKQRESADERALIIKRVDELLLNNKLNKLTN